MIFCDHDYFTENCRGCVARSLEKSNGNRCTFTLPSVNGTGEKTPHACIYVSGHEGPHVVDWGCT